MRAGKKFEISIAIAELVLAVLQLFKNKKEGK